MKTTRLLSHHFCLLGITLCVLSATAAPALPSTSSGNTSANGVLNQLANAFSGGQPVQQVQLSGTASWTAGSLQDSGTVSLTASTNGSSQMQLTLGILGSITETQTGAGSAAGCTWAGNDAVVHTVDLFNCWRPTLWFLPPLSLQPSLLPSYLGVADLGSGTVGSSTSTYRHLQCQLAFPALTATLPIEFTALSTADIGLDPSTFLPSVLAYSVHPDNGQQVSIPIQILYSNYQAVNGVQIPFHIQRYINGSLQLDIVISSAQIN